MAKKSIDWNEWLSPQRVITLGILAVIALVIIIVLGKRIKAAIKEAAGNIRTNIDTQRQIEATGQTPSYTDSVYKDFADRLEVAMKGGGTDEDSVYDVMRQIKNDADMYKLINAFGTRTGAWSWTAESLSQWILGDFNASGRKQINNILASNGVTYRF